MCGVAGTYRPLKASTSTEAMRRAVQAMSATLVHRGPDAEGLWSDPEGRCVLGHRRLSVIDTTDAGLQPMATADGRFVISYNGELYNYLEIRSKLEAAGFRFTGRTDTEVVLQAFAAWGVDALKRFDGMFALAIFDTRSGELLLARDAFGEKPLYFSQLGDGSYAFASELQAMELVPGVDLTASIEAMAEMLTFQYIGAPRSIYQSVEKLRPGHWLRIEPSGITQTGRFFAFRPGSSGFTDRPIADLADELEEILVASIQRRMIADVPLGAFLSGGVDSSTVCALVRRRLNRPLMTFSIGFDGAPESEHLVARKFGKHLGTTHYDKILSPDAAEFLLDFGAKIDEPNGDSSCLPTYLLSEFARQHVTVAISGDGGDEMFGGYGRYFATLRQQKQYHADELAGWKPGSAYYGAQVLVGSEPLIEELFGFVPQGFADHVGLLRTDVDEGQDELLATMRRSDVENYMPGAVLPKVDRMSMQHSLEVRTPFLNIELARFAERLPEDLLVDGGRGKLILKEIAYRYLPRELVDLPKQGFALPMSDWARDSLLGSAGRMLEQEDSRLRQAFGPAGIARFMARQRSPGNFAPYQVWGVVALESWLRHHPARLANFSGQGPMKTAPARTQVA
jgi:asparagine synthase (glutamine-hydrolysing)